MRGGIVANILEFSPHTKHCRSERLRLVILSVAPELNYLTILLTSQIYWLSSEAWLQGYQQGGSKQKGWVSSIFVEQHPAANLPGRKLREPMVLPVSWATDYSIEPRPQGSRNAQPQNHCWMHHSRVTEISDSIYHFFFGAPLLFRMAPVSGVLCSAEIANVLNHPHLCDHTSNHSHVLSIF